MHRTADSRLLSNLLQHEKEYTKQLLTLLDTSNASLTSLAAYAAASPRPLSQVIMAVAGSLAAADDALRRYAHSVELWRETMARLKDMEDEVGNVIRDREILVTRLIKASKSSKPGSAIIGTSVRSSSSLSLSNNQDSPSSRPLSLAFSTSSKLSAAQSELQACELHLAAKERELANSRSAALREGLGARLKALVDCGWAWGEFGKEGLRSLEALQFDSGHPHSTDAESFFLKASSESGISSISPSQSASQINHDHHDLRPPTSHSFRSSELLSAPPLAPELSTNTIRPISMATTNTVTTTGTGSGTSTPAHAALLAATTSTLTYAPAVAVHIPPSSTPSAIGVASGIHAKENETEIMGRSEIHLPIPPPHALGGEYVNIPLAEIVDVVNPSLVKLEGNRSSSPSKLSLSDKSETRGDEHQRVVHLMEGRITGAKSLVEGDSEKDHAHNIQAEHLIPRISQTVVLQSGEPQKVTVDTEKEANVVDEGHNWKTIQDPESSSDEVRVLQKLEVVENAAFMPMKQREAEEKLAEGRERERVPFGSPQTQGGARVASNDKNAKASSSSPSKTFFGSLRGFFGSKDKSAPPTQSASHRKSKLRASAVNLSDSSSSSSNDDWRSPTPKRRKKALQTLLFRPPDKKPASAGAKWELGRGSMDSWNGNASGSGKLLAEESSRTTKGDNEAGVGSVKQSGVTSILMGRMKAGSVDRLELGGTGKQGSHKARTRASSDVGTSIAGGSQSHSPQSRQLQSTRRLKKNRTVGGGSVVERSGSSGSDLEVGGSGSKPTKSASGGPPVAVSATIAKATWVKDYPAGAAAAPSFDQNDERPYIERQSPSRSKSVDIGVGSRRKEGQGSYVLIARPEKDVVHGDGEESLSSPTPSSSKGQIIDLGERRARENERGRQEVVQQWDKSTSNSVAVVKETGKAISRSSSFSSPRKMTSVLTVHSNEQGSAMPSGRRLSRDSSFKNKGGSDIGKTRRTDTLGQSSFNATGARTSTSSPFGALGSSPGSVSISKSTSGIVIGPSSKTTTVTASPSTNLMSIVEDVKRIREAGQIPTSASAKSGTMTEVVRAPPRTSREYYESLAGHRGAGRAGGEMGKDKAVGSALFQVQAPGSVFDHKHQRPEGDSATPSPSTSALGVGVQQRQGPGSVIKTPLKSALKNTSRSPSPSPLLRSAPLPLAASPSVPKGSTMTNGISHLGAPLSITGQGLVDAETESTYESGEEEFFTDEGEPTGQSLFANGVEDNSRTTTVRKLLSPNGQTPRKRKSVRVSLKPTFSPSPPAVEYDEEESFEGCATSRRHHFPKPGIPHPPVPEKHKQIPLHGGGNQNDKWEDSSDEDEGYQNAKAALSRAARKDKEVSLSVFGH